MTIWLHYSDGYTQLLCITFVDFSSDCIAVTHITEATATYALFLALKSSKH